MSQITLYDILARPEKGEHVSWSPAVWRIRLVLNYKQIPYETRWMRISEVTPTLSKEGVLPGEPNSNGKLYTVPTIRMPDEKGGHFVMDSKKIAEELEKVYPEPPLHLDSEMFPKVEKIISSEAMMPMRAAIAPLTLNHLLDYESIPYYKGNLLRMGLDVDKEPDVDDAVQKSKPMIDQLDQLWTENEGPFLLGDTPSYGDLYMIGIMQFQRRASEEAFQKFIGSSKPLERLYKAGEQWLERFD